MKLTWNFTCSLKVIYCVIIADQWSFYQLVEEPLYNYWRIIKVYNLKLKGMWWNRKEKFQNVLNLICKQRDDLALSFFQNSFTKIPLLYWHIPKLASRLTCDVSRYRIEPVKLFHQYQGEGDLPCPVTLGLHLLHLTHSFSLQSKIISRKLSKIKK